MCKLRLRAWLLASAALGLPTCLPAAAAAQTGDLTKLPPEQQLPAAAPASQQEARIGPFKVDASVAAGATYSDNIFVTKNNTVGDTIWTLSPRASALLGGDASYLEFQTGADIGRYDRYTSENYADVFVGGDGRYGVDATTAVFAGARYDWLHEPRESPDSVNGFEPTRYGQGDYYAGFLKSFPKLVLRAGASVSTFSFENTPSSVGLIYNGGRNRTQYEIGARLSYRLSPGLTPFVQAYWDGRDYQWAADSYGYRRTSSGYRVAAGVSGQLAPNLSGEVYAGALGQTYADPRFAPITAPDLGARLTWQATKSTQVNGYLDRSIEETTLPGSAGYLRTAAGGSVDQQIRPDLLATAHFFYSRNDYRDVARIDYVTDAGMGLKYFVLPRIYLGVDYGLLHRTSSMAYADFYEDRVSLRIGAQLDRGWTGDRSSFAQPLVSAPGGLYVGALAAQGGLVTAVDGPRGEPGSTGQLTADFGNLGWEGDLVAGYGALIGHTYLGVEALAGDGSQAWLHTGTGGTRTFSVRKLDSYELAARLGYELTGAAIVYGRVGAVETRFSNDYVTNAATVQSDAYRAGLRVGGGVEFPIVGALFGRMEYVVTNYRDEQVAWGRGVDSFANNEDTMRFGAVYHLGGAPAATPARFDYGGPYVGAQGGFGVLVSQNVGPRSSPQTLDAQRAGTGGTAGLFAGYGYVFRRLYLGAEVEAELSNANWNIQRDPSGRIYSVAKDHTFGASLLGGYVLNSGALLYGRVGGVVTQFDNHYENEGGSAVVEPIVEKAGLRAGGGVAIPLGGKTFARFDYTWTRYGDYKVSYGGASDSFGNTECLFRVGVAHRF